MGDNDQLRRRTHSRRPRPRAAWLAGGCFASGNFLVASKCALSTLKPSPYPLTCTVLTASVCWASGRVPRARSADERAERSPASLPSPSPPLPSPAPPPPRRHPCRRRRHGCCRRPCHIRGPSLDAAALASASTSRHFHYLAAAAAVATATLAAATALSAATVATADVIVMVPGSAQALFLLFIGRSTAPQQCVHP